MTSPSWGRHGCPASAGEPAVALSRQAAAIPSLSQALREARARLLASRHVNLANAAEAREDARELLVLARSGPNRAHDAPLTAAEWRRLEVLTHRREAGEPIARIRGHVDFCGLRMPLTPGVFAPRPSSEQTVAAAVRRLRGRREPLHVDVACGAGPIALAVAAALPVATVVGLDLDPAAVRAARRLGRRLGLANVRFAVGDLLAPLPRRLRGAVDLLTVHPPYIPRGEVRTLPGELRDHEPVSTLTDGSADGLGMVRRLADEAPAWLRPGGWLLVEIGPDLGLQVARSLRRAGLGVAVSRDRAWPTRVVAGQAPGRAGRRR